MQRLSRILCSVLCFLLLLTVLGACGKDTDKPSDASSMTASEYSAQVLSTADVNFVDADGESTYRVVRPENASDEVNTASRLVFKTLKSSFGISPSNVADSEDEEGRAEILIGDTNRESTAKAKELLFLDGSGRAAEYIICTINDDIVIYGMSDSAIVTAVQYFIDNYLKSATVTGGIHYFYNDSGNYTTVTINGIDRLNKFTIVRPIYNVSYITQTETEKLVDTVLAKTGYYINIVHDQVASNTGNKLDGSGTLTPTEPTEYEIIIGNCVREGVNIISDRDTYEIRIEDKKIYLNGGSPYATTMAVSEFIKIIENNTAITSEMSVNNGDYNTAVANYDNATYYMPTWYDNFDGVGTDIDPDGFGIDYTKWRVPWDMKSAYSSAPNGKTQYRSNKALRNTYVENGCLYMCAVETSTAYYGGWFDTNTTMRYRYGFLENSTLHPKGMGFWSALWQISDPHNFEILFLNVRMLFITLRLTLMSATETETGLTETPLRGRQLTVNKCLELKQAELFM